MAMLQLGPGHHGDDEYEYEIHHYEKYHDESKSRTVISASLRRGADTDVPQTPRRKTSSIPKTSPTSRSTIKKPMPRNDRRS